MFRVKDFPVPVPIPVAAYSRIRSRQSSSFKMLDPVHKLPVKQQLVDVEGNTVDRTKTFKGVEVSRDNYATIEGDALEMIERAGATDSVEIERFAELSSIDFGLSLQTFFIVPDTKVPKAADTVQILWNGLMFTKRAAVIENWVPKVGARPSTLVIAATSEGLVGHVIAFAEELYDQPEWSPQISEKIADMFKRTIEVEYSTDAFTNEYVDGYAERRAKAIELALSGEIVTAAAAVEGDKPADTPDLMAALEASLAAVQEDKPAPKPRKAPAKKTTPTKAAA